ncbi:LysR family transcriptional regulator [Alteromonas sp. RKMC-009]|uniref:LysR family transcriptional regulator n=1 Tax=Alteromonas sp. RKMC-009 TaxID=2267264 RepID=UPI000C3949A4|nr:LysR family transcriptional regulator [Alteromonas sp. RKMC-009]AYA66124.1 LysR family transcriptional regulator [Alteromonas sp. RKMC-009]MBT79575.1 LysR family transcriptional regulator [Alteromonadaceae bacterium]MEC7691731.1 LysR family transcriptional regulator [Pseudomonadota bacterium]
MNTKLLRSLQIFVEVANTSNMSIAAKKLHMTVSAISQQLRKLEQEIGLSLFNRNTRHISLTEAGHIYYKTSMELIRVAEEAQHQIEQLQETPSGRLRIVAPEGFGGGLLSKPLQALLSEFPKIKVALELTSQTTDVIASGADLAISLQEVNDVNLHCRHLATWDLIVCVAANHPLADLDTVNSTDLAPHAYISHPGMRDYVESQEGKDKTLPNPPRLMVDSVQALIRLTLDGLGYAVLPEPEVREYIETGKLVNILPEWKAPKYDVYAVAPKHDATPVKTLAAVKCLQESFSLI